jgi:Fe-S-cluster containining protein
VLRERVRRQGLDPELGHCALLVDGQCSVYEQRPLICRSHGLAVGLEDGDELVIDHCHLNYRSEAPPGESVLMLDAVNRPLAMLAELWTTGGGRVELAALASEDS